MAIIWNIQNNKSTNNILKTESMGQFILIADVRIRTSTIKRYKALGEDRINIYFNTSPNRPEVETFKFQSTESRNTVLEQLDSILL